jgi:adenosylcobinamide-phosphate synthase
MLTSALIALGAVLLDWLLGEPRRYHPLVGFGNLSSAVEARFYGDPRCALRSRRLRGALALLLLLAPLTGTAAGLAALPYGGDLIGLFVVTFAIGHKSLHEHAQAVIRALRQGEEAEARRLAGLMVSRDRREMAVSAATTESVLENGNDAIFGALFWFVIAGAPGVLLYRLTNTLDAMWGYRNDRYRDFGWAAARLDDLLNYLPARLTALTYALLGHTGRAIHCWRTQAAAWKSPNAGPVMAAGAGALGVALGGPACYAGQWEARPPLGIGPAADTDDIERALRLVRNSLVLWLALLLSAGAMLHA